MSTADRIKSLMKQRGMTHQQLADLLGVSVNLIHTWFLKTSHRRSVSGNQLKKIAEIFNVSEAYLKYGVGAGVENYNIFLRDGNIALRVADTKYLIDEVMQKYKVNRETVKRCYCYTDDMKMYISEGDILYVDFSENQSVGNGMYILITSDGLAVRNIRKDPFTKSYVVSTPQEEAKIKESEWGAMILHAYRILMIEHTL